MRNGRRKDREGRGKDEERKGQHEERIEKGLDQVNEIKRMIASD